MGSRHTRSLSFPSKSHPVAAQVNELLCRLRTAQAASTSTLTNKLSGLKDLYLCVDEFLQLPSNQNTLSENSVEQVLDGSLRLLDICATSRDVLVQSKERLQDIESVLRRRCISSGELNITNEVVQYQNTRKTIKKTVKNCLIDIKEVEKTSNANSTENMLKNVHSVTVDVFKSLLSYIGGSQKRGWSFSRLVRPKNESETAARITEFDVVDATIDMSQVKRLESKIQEIDEVLECLFRHLIKTRAILLNILSN